MRRKNNSFFPSVVPRSNISVRVKIVFSLCQFKMTLPAPLSWKHNLKWVFSGEGGDRKPGRAPFPNFLFPRFHAARISPSQIENPVFCLRLLLLPLKPGVTGRIHSAIRFYLSPSHLLLPHGKASSNQIHCRASFPGFKVGISPATLSLRNFARS